MGPGDQVLFIICGCWFLVTTAHGRSIIIPDYDHHENGACDLNSRLHPFFTLQVDFMGSPCYRIAGKFGEDFNLAVW